MRCLFILSIILAGSVLAPAQEPKKVKTNAEKIIGVWQDIYGDRPAVLEFTRDGRVIALNGEEYLFDTYVLVDDRKIRLSPDTVSEQNCPIESLTDDKLAFRRGKGLLQLKRIRDSKTPPESPVTSTALFYFTAIELAIRAVDQELRKINSQRIVGVWQPSAPNVGFTSIEFTKDSKLILDGAKDKPITYQFTCGRAIRTTAARPDREVWVVESLTNDQLILLVWPFQFELKRQRQ